MSFRTVVGSIGVTFAMAMLTGCGPGLSHHVMAPSAADAELAGTTTLTSGRAPSTGLKPIPWEDDARTGLQPIPWEDDAPVAPPAQTWGSTADAR
jgi:hypothetical protein